MAARQLRAADTLQARAREPLPAERPPKPGLREPARCHQQRLDQSVEKILFLRPLFAEMIACGEWLTRHSGRGGGASPAASTSVNPRAARLRRANALRS
jgi:hypothetical protein